MRITERLKTRKVKVSSKAEKSLQPDDIMKKLADYEDRDEVGCGWCKRTDGYDRIECSPIDHEGHSLVVDHQIVWCEAEYCPVCGRKLTT